MLTRTKFLATSLAAAVLSGVGAIGFASAGQGTRSDCPGKIVCPITGELVCRYRCPAVDSQRADCPGKIECPLTGELVCKDKCPLGTKTAGDENETLPPCCRK